MFTGIVQSTGKIIDIKNSRLSVTSPWSASMLTLGQSICVDGCCLTLVKFTPESLEFELSPETLLKTTWGDRQAGDRVNLEPSLTLNSLLDGHMVSGRVDGVGLVRSLKPTDTLGSWEFWFDMPAHFQSWLIQKGSVCINGVSLTVNALDPQGFSVAIIPHTYAHTNLSDLSVGSHVNFEFDVIAKYVARTMELGIQV